MIRHLETRIVSLQFHVIYSNKFETVMGGYEDNEVVTNHTWDILVTGRDDENIENDVHHAEEEQQPISKINTDWLSSSEQNNRQSQALKNEIRQKLRAL